MLVLSRKAGTAIVFPDLGIEVTVLECGRYRTRIGIDAPDEVEIFRKEILPFRRPRKEGSESDE